MELVRFAIGVICISIFSAYVHMGDPIVSSYLSSGLIIFLFLVFLFEGYLFGKKYTIQPSKNLTQKEKDFIEKHKLVFEIFARCIYFTLVIGGFLLIVLPCIKDLPAIINDDYSYVTGEIVSVATDDGNRKEVKIRENKTGEEIYIVINYKEINIGQEYTIKYLPNLLRGEIVENKITNN